MPSRSQLSQYILKSKYAKYLPEKKRRESFDEAVTRVEQMMVRKYPHIEKSIEWAYKFVRDGKVLGSQRTLQFAGEAIERRNARSYNCVTQYADRLRFFQETFWLLLCGCGVGFSVQKQHVARIPKFVVGDREDIAHTIEDSIEGWADAAGVLLGGYLDSPAIVTFDYSKIRPQGSLISTGGKAPGPEPLRKALEQIRTLLDRCVADDQEQLRSIDVFDIVMYLADSVLSGGVRRSATLCLFSPDDTLMVESKTGNWYAENPQRARANISAMLVRDETSYDQFQEFFTSTKEWGEPGFYWADNTEMTPNPCQPAWAKVLTQDGIRTINDLQAGDKIWSREGWTNVVKKWSTGMNEVYRYGTTAGVFYGTEHHRLVSNGVKVEAKDADSVDILTGPDDKIGVLHEADVMNGLVLGDGSVHKASNNLVYLLIGKDDGDYHDSEIAHLIKKHRPGVTPLAWEVETQITCEDLPYTYDRRVPEFYIQASPQRMCGFLRGLYTANGSICGRRVTLKSSSFGLIEDVQLMLSALGIRSYYTTNKSTKVEFSNGVYECKQSYDLNISVDIALFESKIGFVQLYKADKLRYLVETYAREPRGGKSTYDIVSTDFVAIEETFDLTVDNNSHTYWTQGCDVSNCVEVSFAPSLLVDESRCVDGKYNGVPVRLAGTDPAYRGREIEPNQYLVSGSQFCNLCSIFMTTVKSPHDFLERCRAAGVIGTLQAGFTDFAYLGSVSEEITRREALLGVSLTGVMDKPQFGLNAELLEQGVGAIAKANEEIAAKIGINKAARLTALKPEGTGSLLLGTLATGRHGWPFKRGIRHVQGNRLEAPLAFLRSVNPTVVERSSWSANDTDEVLAFPIEAPEGAVLESDMTAIESLDQVKLLQKHWINPGRRAELCTQPWLNNSVSNTIKVGPDEWDDVARKIYDDNEFYTGLSLLARTGDKDYRQAPNVSVKTSAELLFEYGQRALDAAVELLDDREIKTIFPSLWDYCDAIMGMTKGLRPSQVVAVGRARTQIGVFFYGDVKSITYLLKDVYYTRRYDQLVADWKPVPWEDLVEDDDTTNVSLDGACSGGACAI